MTLFPGELLSYNFNAPGAEQATCVWPSLSTLHTATHTFFNAESVKPA